MGKFDPLDGGLSRQKQGLSGKSSELTATSQTGRLKVRQPIVFFQFQHPKPLPVTERRHDSQMTCSASRVFLWDAGRRQRIFRMP
jgi:hypothetical protein